MNFVSTLAILFLLHFSYCTEQALQLSNVSNNRDSLPTKKRGDVGAGTLVLKSTDGGQTWQNIGLGLPEPVKDKYGMSRNISFTNINGLYISAGNKIYHNKPNATIPTWNKGVFPVEQSSIAPGKAGIYAYNTWGGGIFFKTNKENAWSPVFPNFKEQRVLNVFESAAGSVFIGTDGGLFKSADNGKAWKKVHASGMTMKLVESDGVLLATNGNGIIRSANDGENWDWVIREDRRGYVAESIKGGFAVSFDQTPSEARKVQASYDNGKTWQSISGDLPTSHSISSIIQVEENFFCSHPNGIYQSNDKGKTWKLILPSTKGKTFNLYVSGSVIYAISVNQGC